MDILQRLQKRNEAYIKDVSLTWHTKLGFGGIMFPWDIENYLDEAIDAIYETKYAITHIGNDSDPTVYLPEIEKEIESLEALANILLYYRDRDPEPMPVEAAVGIWVQEVFRCLYGH